MARHGSFYWNELMTRDTLAARTFYERTLGWSFEPMPMEGGGTYWVAACGGGPVGGIMDISGPEFEGEAEAWFAHVAVDDVDARIAAARAAGARILREPFDVPGVGRIAILRQPDGALVGWMTPAEGVDAAAAG